MINGKIVRALDVGYGNEKYLKIDRLKTLPPKSRVIFN